jgi:glutamyl-tRNA reductase
VIISSTGAEDPVLSRDQVAGAMQRRKNRPMFLIDIAIPRDIDPDAGDLYNVFLYDIDDLESVVGANLQKRQQEAARVEAILEEEVAAFLAWQNSLGVVPAIVAMRAHFQGVMEAELDRAKLSDLTEDQKAQVLDVVRRYANKLLHSPITRLKEVAEVGDALAYVEALAHLFDLELQEEGAKGVPTEQVRS